MFLLLNYIYLYNKNINYYNIPNIIHNLIYGDQTFKTTDNYLFHKDSIYDFFI